MLKLVEYLERGITLTTPIFFIIVLIALLRSLRLLDMSMKTLMFLQKRILNMEKQKNVATSRRKEEEENLKIEVINDWDADE